jgi:hypothetical protein
MPTFEVGDRVRTVGCFEFPDGTTGIISMPPPTVTEVLQPGEWHGHCHQRYDRKGLVISYYVEFDKPADDGSGDGPYQASEIASKFLELL